MRTRPSKSAKTHMKRDRSSNHRAYTGLWQVLCADIIAFSLVFLYDSSSESLIPVPILKDSFPSEDFLVCLDVIFLIHLITFILSCLVVMVV